MSLLSIKPCQQCINAINFNFQDSARLEKQAKERLSREKDVLIAEKFNLEQQLAVSVLRWQHS